MRCWSSWRILRKERLDETVLLDDRLNRQVRADVGKSELSDAMPRMDAEDGPSYKSETTVDLDWSICTEDVTYSPG